jgi:predicted secreted protein
LKNKQNLEKQVKHLKSQHRRGAELLKIVEEYQQHRQFNTLKEQINKFIQKKDTIEAVREERKEKEIIAKIKKENPFAESCPKCNSLEMLKLPLPSEGHQLICTSCGYRRKVK